MKKPAPKKPAPKKPAANKPVAKKPPAKKPPAKKPAPRHPGARADYGSPIDGFFLKQPPPLRAILEELRRLVEAAAPDAESAIKWGMPFYSVGGNMMCALGGHKAHVNLVMVGREGTFADPEGRLEGDSKGSRHLKLTSLDELPRKAVSGWLRSAAAVARSKPPRAPKRAR